MVIDPEGAVIGEVSEASPESMELSLGGWHDAWGFVDLSPGTRVRVPTSKVAFGPPRTVGLEVVMVSTQRPLAMR